MSSRTVDMRSCLPEDEGERERLLVGMFRGRRRPPEPPSESTRRKAQRLAAGLLAATEDTGAPSGDEVPF